MKVQSTIKRLSSTQLIILVLMVLFLFTLRLGTVSAKSFRGAYPERRFFPITSPQKPTKPITPPGKPDFPVLPLPSRRPITPPGLK